MLCQFYFIGHPLVWNNTTRQGRAVVARRLNLLRTLGQHLSERSRRDWINRRVQKQRQVLR